MNKLITTNNIPILEKISGKRLVLGKGRTKKALQYVECERVRNWNANRYISCN